MKHQSMRIMSNEAGKMSMTSLRMKEHQMKSPNMSYLLKKLVRLVCCKVAQMDTVLLKLAEDIEQARWKDLILTGLELRQPWRLIGWV